MKGRIVLVGSLVLMFSLAACYSAPAASPSGGTTNPPAASAPSTTPAPGSASPSAPVPSPTPVPSPGSPAPAPAKAATLKVGQNATLGQFLTDDQGRTLYLFLQDTSSASTCYAACAEKWPPLLSQGAPTGQTGVSTSLLGTSQRTDGTAMVTYNGHPLYYYTPDQKPGDTIGQGVGSVWYVVSPAGQAVK